MVNSKKRAWVIQEEKVVDDQEDGSKDSGEGGSEGSQQGQSQLCFVALAPGIQEERATAADAKAVLHAAGFADADIGYRRIVRILKWTHPVDPRFRVYQITEDGRTYFKVRTPDGVLTKEFTDEETAAQVAQGEYERGVGPGRG